MSSGLNKVMIIGNLGRDAELRYTPGGMPVATINVAATEFWNDKNGKRQERTEWFRCVIWDKQAESLAEYLTKGKQVYIEGKLQTKKWQDKAGQDRYTTEVRVDRVVLLWSGSKGGGGNYPPHPAETTNDAVAQEPQEPQTVPDDSDIPF